MTTQHAATARNHAVDAQLPIEVRLLCADDDDLHTGLVGLVAALRHRGIGPEILVAGTGCSRRSSRVDLLVVCRGPGSTPACPHVRDSVASVEASGGGVITIDLDGELDANVARVHRCASLQVAIAAQPGKRDDEASVRRVAGPRGRVDERPQASVVGSIEPMPPWLHVVQPFPASLEVSTASSRDEAPAVPPAIVAVRSPAVSASKVVVRGSSKRRLTAIGIAGLWSFAGLLFGLAQLPTDSEPSQLAGSLATTMSFRASPSETPPPVAEEAEWSLAVGGSHALASGEVTTHDLEPAPRTQGVVTNLASDSGAQSRPVAPRRVKRLDEIGPGATAPMVVSGDNAEPVAESAHCRDTRRRATDARTEQRWEDARALLGERDCWPAAEIRSALLRQVDEADPR